MADTPRSAVRLEDRRPLSPHLQIYRPILTMMMSIAHRITGIVLYVGTVLVVWYLVAAATGADTFNRAYAVLGSIPGQIVLLGFTWAWFHHLLGGVRHAIWDTGYGMDAKGRELLAAGTLVGGVLLTLLFWFGAYFLR